MFSSYEIREYRPGDAPGLTSLWCDTFGDDRALVERFFELLPSMGNGFVADCPDGPVGAAYLLDVHLFGSSPLPTGCSYIYAVAVEPEQRGQGIGASLLQSCMRHAALRGDKAVFTLPANPQLYRWYSRTVGMDPVMFCRTERVEPSDAKADIRELFADEYGYARYGLLKNEAHIGFDYGYLSYQLKLCQSYGGGMYACSGGIACGYLDGNVLLIKEALSDPPEFIPALCRRLGAEYALVRRRGDTEPYIAAHYFGKPIEVSEWGLSLD